MMWDLMESGTGNVKGVSKVGLKHMAMWENGFRNYTNNDHAIETPADCKGQKSVQWKIQFI